MKNFIFFWLPPFLWMGFLFPSNDTLTVSSTSCIIVPIIKWLFPHADQATIETLHILTRKFVHFFEYALLAFLLFRGFRGRNKSWQWQWILYAGIITIGYGAIDEFLQTQIPSRTGSFSDWMINSAGAVFALSGLSAFSLMRMRTWEDKKVTKTPHLRGVSDN
jgi:VanZ family protein